MQATDMLRRYQPRPPSLVAVCGPMTQVQCPLVAQAVAALRAEGYAAQACPLRPALQSLLVYYH